MPASKSLPLTRAAALPSTLWKGLNSSEAAAWYPWLAISSGNGISEVFGWLFWDTKWHFPKRPTSLRFFQMSPCISFSPGAWAGRTITFQSVGPLPLNLFHVPTGATPLMKQRRNMRIIWQIIFGNTLSNGIILSPFWVKKLFNFDFHT